MSYTLTCNFAPGWHPEAKTHPCDIHSANKKAAALNIMSAAQKSLQKITETGSTPSVILFPERRVDHCRVVITASSIEEFGCDDESSVIKARAFLERWLETLFGELKPFHRFSIGDHFGIGITTPEGLHLAFWNGRIS